jgi:hypothetical protein
MPSRNGVMPSPAMGKTVAKIQHRIQHFYPATNPAFVIHCYRRKREITKGYMAANNPAKNMAVESASLMEPMLPPEGERRLEDLAIDLASKASALAGQVNPVVQQSIGTLVRSMNCYYSNLIEGHDTHPRDIDRALAKNYAREPQRRALQLEAVAHIEVQTEIDEKRDNQNNPISMEYIVWLNREFCRRLPEELLLLETSRHARENSNASGRVTRR